MKTTNSLGDSLFWICFSVFVVLLICGSAFSAEKDTEIGPGKVGQILVFQRGYGDECFWFFPIKEYPVLTLEQKKGYTLLRHSTTAEKEYAKREYWGMENSVHEKWIWPYQIGEQK